MINRMSLSDMQPCLNYFIAIGDETYRFVSVTDRRRTLTDSASPRPTSTRAISFRIDVQHTSDGPSVANQ